MKKLLIILMVVAVASFLFVGCLGTTPPIDPDEPVEPVLPTTVAPVITSVPDIVGGYINKANAADGIVVNGTAPTYSEVKVYINGLTAGTGDTTETGAWTVDVANADLIKAVKTDGAKVLYAKATEAGLEESDSSNVRSFILDTVIPSITSSVGRSGTVVAYTCTEIVDTMNLFTEVCPSFDPLNLLLAGTVNWRLEVLSVFTGVVADDMATVRITNLNTGTFIDYTFGNVGIISSSWIQGVDVTTIVLTSAGDIGAYCLITTTNTPLSLGTVDVTFNEAVTGISITGGNWTLFAASAPVANTLSVRSATVGRLTEVVAGSLATGIFYSVSASDIMDLAGNTIPPGSPSTDTGVVIP